MTRLLFTFAIFIVSLCFLKAKFVYSDHRKNMLPSTLEIICFWNWTSKRFWDLTTVLDAILSGDLPPHDFEDDRVDPTDFWNYESDSELSTFVCQANVLLINRELSIVLGFSPFNVSNIKTTTERGRQDTTEGVQIHQVHNSEKIYAKINCTNWSSFPWSR